MVCEKYRYYFLEDYIVDLEEIDHLDENKWEIHYKNTKDFTMFTNNCAWEKFKSQYDKHIEEKLKMPKDTFRIRNRDYPLSQVVGFDKEDFIVSFERKYEKLTQQQFGDFLIAYGEWIKQRKEPVNYPDGWYRAKGTKGLYRVFRLKNNVIYHPKLENVNNLKIDDPTVVWKDIQRIDVMSDEFVELFKETIQ